MAVAGRGTAATIVFPAQISPPPNFASHHVRCGMGWLDSVAYCRFSPHVDRGVNDAHRPSPANTPMVAPSSITSPTVAGPIVSVPSAELTTAAPPIVPRPVVAVPPAEPATAQLDQEQVPSAPAAENVTRGPEPRMARPRAQHKSPRTARKIHASHVRRVLLFPTPGVLTPPLMTWHGGGY
jgi:hypothetical protein